MTTSPAPPGREEYSARAASVMRVCRRLAEGETMASIVRDPTMPSECILRGWMKDEPAFWEIVTEAKAQGEAARALRRRRAPTAWTPELEDELLARIVDGRGLVDVCREADMPDHSTVTRRLAADERFAARYAAARDAQADVLFDLAWRIACEATEGTVRTARLKVDTLRWRVGKLAPRRYGPALAVRKGQAEAEPVATEFWIKDWIPSEDGREAIPLPATRARPYAPGEPVMLWYPEAPAPEPPRRPEDLG